MKNEENEDNRFRIDQNSLAALFPGKYRKKSLKKLITVETLHSIRGFGFSQNYCDVNVLIYILRTNFLQEMKIDEFEESLFEELRYFLAILFDHTVSNFGQKFKLWVNFSIKFFAPIYRKTI